MEPEKPAESPVAVEESSDLEAEPETEADQPAAKDTSLFEEEFDLPEIEEEPAKEKKKKAEEDDDFDPLGDIDLWSIS